MSVQPQIIATTEPYGFTQYIDADGDFLTFGEVEDGTERQVYGIVAAIATPNADGMGLSAEQARDLARRLVAAADKAEKPKQIPDCTCPAGKSAPSAHHRRDCATRRWMEANIL